MMNPDGRSCRAWCLALAALTGCAGVRAPRPPTDPVWRDGPSPTSSQPIFILGEVRRPGMYPAEPGVDLVEYMTRVHGFAETADLDKIEFLRRSGGTWQSRRVSWGRLHLAPRPRGGDVLMVHSNRQSKFERRLQLGTLIASLLASVSALFIAVERR